VDLGRLHAGHGGLIRELFGDEGQQKAFGVFGPVMGLAAIAGPLVGGGLVNLNVVGTGWRAIFLVNVPLGLAAIAAGRRFLPKTAPATPGLRLDAPSVTLAMVGGFALVYPLIHGREHGWPMWSFALLAGGVLTLTAFGMLQAHRKRQGRAPLGEPSILKRRGYVAGLAVVLGFIGAMGGMMIALNVMFQTGSGSPRWPARWPRWRSRSPRSPARSPPRPGWPRSAGPPCTSASWSRRSA
jgi:Major Facilitator Superfamily